MGGYEVGEVGTGATELDDRMVNGTSFTHGLLQSQELVGVAGLCWQRLVSTISWWKLGVLESDRGRFGEEVLG